MAIRTAVVVAGGVVIAMTVGACGGGSSSAGAAKPTSSATKSADAAFTANADAICAPTVKKSTTEKPFPFPSFKPLHPKISDLHAIGVYFNHVSDLGVLRQIAALHPPPDKASAWPAFHAALLKDISLTAAQYHAALTSNGPAFVATVRAFERSHGALVVSAAKLGFTNTPGSECGLLLNGAG